MNKEQYNNVINWTLTNDESTQTGDSLTATRAVLNNMGVALPQGNVSEVSEILQTNSYMGWESATFEEAQAAANDGTAAIAVSESDVMMIAAEADGEDTEATFANSAITTVGELTVAEASGMDYYTYSSAGTATSGLPRVISDGQYYLNNRHTGKFMVNSDSAVAMHGGTLAELGTTIRWSITRLDNGYYSIRSLKDISKFLGVQASPLNSSNIELVTTAFLDLPERCMWKITRHANDLYRIQSVYNERYLSTSGAIFMTHEGYGNTTNHEYSCRMWRIVNVSEYGNSSDYAYQELPEICSINDLYIQVGESKIPTLDTGSIKTLLTDPFDFTYTFASTGFFSVNSLNGEFCGKNVGSNIFVTAEHKPTGRTQSFRVTIDSLLIYRTRNRETVGFSDSTATTPTQAEDLQYGQKSTIDITNNNSYISLTDLYTSAFTTDQIPMSERISEVRTFFHTQIQYNERYMSILDDMLDHFVGGTGNVYSNAMLTEDVEEHEETTGYVSEIIALLSTYLSNSGGNISGLYYDEALWTQIELRNQHPMVRLMLDKIALDKENGVDDPPLYQPVYGYANPIPGLALCLDSLYGNKFEITSYELIGEKYSGCLKFTFYDHFGLDTLDLSEKKMDILAPGVIPAFRQWYIMQHWDELNAPVHPKPYVTKITFFVQFAGTI